MKRFMMEIVSRFILLLAVVALMAAMFVANAVPAFAGGDGVGSNCDRNQNVSVDIVECDGVL